MKFENRIIINAHVQKVWDVFTDESMLKAWLSGYKSSRTLSGKPLTIGSKHEMVLEENGREMKFIETVTQVDVPSTYGFTLSHDKMCSKNLTTLKESGEQTELIQQVDFKATSFLFKLMMPLLKSSICKKSEKDLIKLKALIENDSV